MEHLLFPMDGLSHFLATKYNAQGRLLWSGVLGDTGEDVGYGDSILIKI